MVGRLPRVREQAGTARGFDRENELLALRVLLDLRVEAYESLQELDEAARFLPALLEHTRKTRRARNEMRTRAVHRDVAVTLEKAHHAADAFERIALFGCGEQTHHAAVGHRVFTGPLLLADRVERLDQPLGVGLDVLEQLVDERQEMLTQPRDAG